MDVLCVLHDSDEYGVARYPLAELARAAGVPLRLLKELAEKGVLKGADKAASPFVWAPFHAGKRGDEVVLVAESEGPCWYCSRFVRDEYVRQRRGSGTRFTADNQPDKPSPNQQPMPPPKAPFGEPQGDGASSASSSAYTPDRSLGAEGSLSARAEVEPPPEPTREPPTPIDPTAAGRACLAMRRAGVMQTNPSHPSLLAALAEGASDADFENTAREALGHSPPKGFAWVIATVRGRLADAKSGATSHAAPRNGARLSAADRVLANVRAAQRRDQQQGGDDPIDGEALRIAR